MICVIAKIEVGVGKRDQLIELFRPLIPKVKAEQGNFGYEILVDTPSGLPGQSPVCNNVLTVVEHWESLEILKAHLKTDHMSEYFCECEKLDATMQLQILTPA
jgi:quinol monooxygenase YgiN